MSTYANEDREKRETTRIEKTDLMTIKFLRARLLAERSVSKTARQRANELASRVAELEQQLKFVSLQREKAEKATADILVILKKHGIGDVAEEFDSSAEQEEDSQDFEARNGEENSTNVKLGNDEVEVYSSSEIESSPSTGRSLSWKNIRDSQNSFEKKKYIDPVRRRASFSLSSRRVGKSCRRIKHRDTRSVDELQNDSIEKTTHSKGSSNCSDGKEDMESALLHQAELIGQYEEEEKAQREWEDKFRERENNSGIQDSYDPGNYSDVTEERYDTKPLELSSAGGALDSNNQESTADARMTSKASPEKGSDTVAPESSASDFSFPKSLKSLEDSVIEHEHTPPKPSPYAEKNTPVLQETSSGLGSVLEALQRAKLSLNQKLSRSVTETGSFQIPFGTPDLFRLPTDRLDPGIDSRSIPSSVPHESTAERLLTEPFVEQRSTLSGDMFHAVPRRTFTPAMRSSGSHLDPYSNPVLRDCYRFLPDIKLQISSKEQGLSRTFPTSEKGLPPVVRLSSYDGNAAPNIYR